LAEALTRLTRLRERGAADQARLAEDVARKGEEEKSWEAEAARGREAAAAARQAFDAAENAAEEIRLALAEREAQRRAAERARGEAERVAEEVAAALRDEEVTLASLGGELKACDETYVAKYDVRLSLLGPDEYRLTEEEAAATAERDELGQRLAKMGEINFLAAREYDELAAQLATLEEQRADLEQARANLDQSIARIDAQSREVVLATFERIRLEFQQTFRQAFSGGQADLKLQTGVDPLEAGVYIYAQPPGKKMEHLSLLSGGEKALTAIALIFALFNVKPAPFAILDEVDAPLDEHNIGRFITLLGAYRDRVQFMVITHARLTMDAADAIYGVTMERKGISKVLSLSLTEVPDEYLTVGAAS
jgi:chromosome segregation protein